MSERLERLMNLLAALIETPRPLSRSELFERVPGYSSDPTAARRSFERDKDALRSMGIPIALTPLDEHYPEHGDGYRVLPEDYYLPDPGLTREELSALALAASAVKLRSQAASAALWKLGADPQVQAATEVEVPASDELAIVFAARRERRSITFTYKGHSRSLDPYRMTFRNGRWYVNGFDHLHGDVRTFRLDRIEGDIVPGEANNYRLPPPTDTPWLPPWRMGDSEPITARVWVDAGQAPLAVAQAGAETVEERRDDGSIVLALSVSNRDALRSFVLGLLDHAELLSPPELRADLVRHVRAMAHG